MAALACSTHSVQVCSNVALFLPESPATLGKISATAFSISPLLGTSWQPRGNVTINGIVGLDNE
ncbi:hypothetical protein ACSS6W_004897 [Trichoderma asperelloides]